DVFRNDFGIGDLFSKAFYLVTQSELLEVFDASSQYLSDGFLLSPVVT
ncbi:22062_t:CDS:2, partial [Racocetra persica]